MSPVVKASPKKFVLVGEPVFSWGRIVALTAAGGLLFFIYLDVKNLMIGKIYNYALSTWIIDVFGYVFFTSLIVGGLLWHRRQQWPEFILYLYEDGWTRALFKDSLGIVDWDGDLPPSLICCVSKYRKRYSKKRENWYIRLNYEVYYNGNVYSNINYGWVKEPKDIEEWDKFVDLLRQFAEENRRKREMKIPPRILWFGLRTWSKLDYAQKLMDEREKQLGEKYDQ